MTDTMARMRAQQEACMAERMTGSQNVGGSGEKPAKWTERHLNNLIAHAGRAQTLASRLDALAERLGVLGIEIKEVPEGDGPDSFCCRADELSTRISDALAKANDLLTAIEGDF